MKASAEERQMAAALMEVSGVVVQVLEAVAGYREQAKTHGFSDAAAERMALDYHGSLMAMIAAAQKGVNP